MDFILQKKVPDTYNALANNLNLEIFALHRLSARFTEL